MKDIIPAINRLQNACFDETTSMNELGAARKALMAAIRQAMTECALAATKDTASTAAGLRSAAGVHNKESLLEAYLARFDKLNGGD